MEMIHLVTDDRHASVDSLRTLTDQGWDLFAMVVNRRAVHPYTDSSTLACSIRVEIPPAYRLCQVSYDLIGHYRVVGADTTTYTSSALEGTVTGHGSFSGNTFTGTLDRYDEYAGVRWINHIVATLNDTWDSVRTVDVQQRIEVGTRRSELELTAGGIPIDWGSGSFEFEIYDASVCDHITYLSHALGISDLDSEGSFLESYECTSSSLINVYFDTEILTSARQVRFTALEQD
jgi:hypothetical protein